MLHQIARRLDERSEEGDLVGRVSASVFVVAHDLNPLLGVLTGAIYLVDGHPHFAEIGHVAPAAQLDAVGRARHDGVGRGQVADQDGQLGLLPGEGDQRGPLGELVHVDEPKGHRVVQPPERAVAVGVGDAQDRDLVAVGHPNRLLRPGNPAAVP
mgnify:CR=1 FL=1